MNKLLDVRQTVFGTDFVVRGNESIVASIIKRTSNDVVEYVASCPLNGLHVVCSRYMDAKKAIIRVLDKHKDAIASKTEVFSNGTNEKNYFDKDDGESDNRGNYKHKNNKTTK